MHICFHIALQFTFPFTTWVQAQVVIVGPMTYGTVAMFNALMTGDGVTGLTEGCIFGETVLGSTSILMIL